MYIYLYVSLVDAPCRRASFTALDRGAVSTEFDFCLHVPSTEIDGNFNQIFVMLSCRFPFVLK